MPLFKSTLPDGAIVAVRRHCIPLDETFTLNMSEHTKILDLGVERDGPFGLKSCIWTLEETFAPMVNVDFRLMTVNQQIWGKSLDGYEYIGRLDHYPTGYHVFAKVPDVREPIQPRYPG